MTWHFTHDKVQTIAALLHNAGTPCFAHCIDYVFGDYTNQESSEKEITEMIKQDKEILSCLKEDHITVEMLAEMNQFPILENKSPQLCTDQLDGVLHTCYIWLHTHSLEQIQEVYNDLIVLQNEYGNPEIGFQKQEIADKFIAMVYQYAKELQGNTDKYVMKYISEIVKLAVEQNLITLNDLYTKPEKDIVGILSTHFSSWKTFEKATTIIGTNQKPNHFHISFATKKRNTIPLVAGSNGNKRISSLSDSARNMYTQLDTYQDSTYAYIESLKKL